MSKAPERPELEAIESIIEVLDLAASNLMCEIVDEQEYCEWEVELGYGRYDDFSEDDAGNKFGIVYPENAAPELDGARSQVLEAIDLLHDYIANRKHETDLS